MTEAHVYKMTGNLKLKNAPPGPLILQQNVNNNPFTIIFFF